MKTKKFSVAFGTGWGAVVLAISQAASGQVPPTITELPGAQSAAHGADAAISLQAGGTEPLSFQWRKDGVALADYENVAGSETATLQLLGVAQSDAGAYSVVVSNAFGCLTSSPVTFSVEPLVIFADGFENGLGLWHELETSNALSLDNNFNHTSPGSRSAVASQPGQWMYHNLDAEIPGRVRFTFWMRDDGTNFAWAEIRGYTGAGHAQYIAPGGLQQALAVGAAPSELSSRNSGALAGEALDPARYQGSVRRGTNSGWFNLDASNAPVRSVGWHKFSIVRWADGATVEYFVDDVLGRRIRGAAPVALDCVAMGSAAAGKTSFDDFKVDAYPETFDWQSLETGGPFPDWMKARETGTSAESLNSAAGVQTVWSANGSATNGGLGNWAPDGVGIYNNGCRGYVEYDVIAPRDDIYRIEIEGREKGYNMPRVELPLDVSLDGEFLARANLPYGPATNGIAHCFTPFIRLGAHTLRIYWDNAEVRRSLYLETVRLQAVGTPDARGKKIWVTRRLAVENGVEVAPLASTVSPACVEGRGQFLSFMSMSAGADEPLEPVAIFHGAGNRWYANVPLSPAGPTRVETSFQNGGQNETNEIAWQITNVLLETNAIAIRKDDSLLLTALPQGASSGDAVIVISDGTQLRAAAAEGVAHQFTEEGVFTVGGLHVPSGQRGRKVVKVVAASFERSIPSRVNHNRFWDCANLPPGVALEADPRLKVERIADEMRARQLPTPPPLGPNGRQYRISTRSNDPRYVVARLGRDGPILDSAAIQGFRWFTSPDSYLRLIQTYADGSQLVESMFILSPVLPTLTATVEIIVAGVTFEDGTVFKTLRPEDFDALGACKIHFIRAAGVKTSVCHVTKLYDDGFLIGWK